MHHHVVSGPRAAILPKLPALRGRPGILAAVNGHDHIPALLATHILPGIFALVIGAVLLCAWEVANLTGLRYGRGWHYAVPAVGVALGVVSCVLMAARFAYIQ
jgi:hypothetical protein